MKKIIGIEGMSCNHCKMRVTKALYGVKGVASAEVDVAKKNAVVELNGDVTDDALKQAVLDSGYSPTSVTPG